MFSSGVRRCRRSPAVLGAICLVASVACAGSLAPPGLQTDEMTEYIIAARRHRESLRRTLQGQFVLEQYWNEANYRAPATDELPTHQLSQFRLWIGDGRWYEELYESLPKQERRALSSDGERCYSYSQAQGHSVFSDQPPVTTVNYLDLDGIRESGSNTGTMLKYRARYLGEERCGGRQTYKMEARVDENNTWTWWISPELGFAVVKVLLAQSGRTPDEPPLQLGYYLYDRFRDAGGGLWIPDSSRRLGCELHPGNPPNWFFLFRFTALDLELNRPSQGLPLDWIIPLGTRIFDDRGSIYPAGGDLRDVTAAMQARRPPDPVLLVPEPSAAAAAYTHPPAPR